MPVMTGVAIHCPYCALQCGMTVGHAGEISPRQFPTNRGGLCRTGGPDAVAVFGGGGLTNAVPAGQEGAA